MQIEEEAQYEQQALFVKFWTKKNKATTDAALAEFNLNAGDYENVVVVSIGSSSTQFYNKSGSIVGGVYAGTEAMKTDVGLVDKIFEKIKEQSSRVGGKLILLFCNSIAFLINDLERSLDLQKLPEDKALEPIVVRLAENVARNADKVEAGIILHRNQYKMKNDWVQIKAQQEYEKLAAGSVYFVAEFGGGGIVMNYYNANTKELIEYNKDRFILGRQAEFVKAMQNVDENHPDIEHIKQYIFTQVNAYIAGNNIDVTGKRVECHIYQSGQLRESYYS